MPYLFFLFTAIPLLELYLLFQLSGVFGFWTTIGVVLGTGIVGAALARWQGWRAMARLQTEMRQGILPVDALGDGVLILIASVLLITPGVLTDVMGLSLLIPPIRALVKHGLRRWLAGRVQVGNAAFWTEGPPQFNPDASAHSAAHTSRDEIIDVRVIDTHIVDEDS